MSASELTFWDHLDELRGVLIRIAVAVVVCGCVAFVFKDQLFGVIFAAQDSDFVTYRLFETLSFGAGSVEAFSVDLISTQLTQQFSTHLSVSMWVGFLVIFPYILFELFRFISPALYATERRYAAGVVGWGYVMFVVGVAVSYFLIFPLTFRFLAGYQVSASVENMIALDSYIGTLVTLCMMMGVLFELPILCWFFAKLGFLTADMMRHYRRYAIVVLLFISALITPTADVITMLLVALPIYLLYELSIVIISATNKAIFGTSLDS